MLRFMPRLLDGLVSSAFPMNRKGDACEMMSILFEREGVPPEMIMYGSKEQTPSNFKKKLKEEADCHQEQIKPHLP